MPAPAQSRTKSIADNVAVAGNQRIGLGPLRSLCSQKNKIDTLLKTKKASPSPPKTKSNSRKKSLDFLTKIKKNKKIKSEK